MIGNAHFWFDNISTYSGYPRHGEWIEFSFRGEHPVHLKVSKTELYRRKDDDGFCNSIFRFDTFRGCTGRNSNLVRLLVGGVVGVLSKIGGVYG